VLAGRLKIAVSSVAVYVCGYWTIRANGSGAAEGV